MFKNILRKIRNKKEKESRHIARIIGEYYLNKNIFDYIKTQEEIRTLCITQVEHKGDTVFITLQRPGILIGERGNNLDQLQKFISSKTKYLKVDIKEDNIISWIIPYDYSDWQNDF